MIRAFMRTTFPKVIDIIFIIAAVGVLLGAFRSASAFGGFSLLAFLLTFIMGAVILILTFGMFYVMLDIRDALEKKKE